MFVTGNEDYDAFGQYMCTSVYGSTKAKLTNKFEESRPAVLKMWSTQRLEEILGFAFKIKGYVDRYEHRKTETRAHTA